MLLWYFSKSGYSHEWLQLRRNSIFELLFAQQIEEKRLRIEV